jgi:hypothetical protein
MNKEKYKRESLEGFKMRLEKINKWKDEERDVP